MLERKDLSGPTKDFLAGTTAGFTVKAIDHPFDTIKVLLQTQPSDKPAYRNAWHCFQSTVKKSGFASLYNGISSPLLGSMAENAILFWGYSHCRAALGETLSNKLTLGELALAGAGAGFLAPLVNTPVELVKCRLQVQASAGATSDIGSGTAGSIRFQQYKGPIDVIVQTIRKEGIVRGLYKGNMSTLAREVPGNFVWYGAYETVCHMMIPPGGTKDDLGPTTHWLGGAMAGAGYWTAFYPADTVKSRIQTISSSPSSPKIGFVDIFQQIYKQQGIRGLYRGWGITVARAAPGHGLIFVVYEYTLKLLRGN